MTDTNIYNHVKELLLQKGIDSTVVENCDVLKSIQTLLNVDNTPLYIRVISKKRGQAVYLLYIKVANSNKWLLSSSMLSDIISKVKELMSNDKRRV